MITSSRWSGKCDCFDVLIDIHNYTLEELQNNVKIYVGDNDEPLHINSMEDLILYYPYILCSDESNMCCKSIKKVAMPQIGCGLDRLKWDKVSEIIQKVFADIDIEILVCSL